MEITKHINIPQEVSSAASRTLQLTITLLFTFILVFTGASFSYAEDIIPYACSNTSISGVSESALVATSSGYSRVFCDGSKVYAEDYDNDFAITARREIPMELSIYGGFYAGSDAYYFVFGELNLDENTGAEVLRVVKYNKKWQRESAASLTGDSAFAHEVRRPFRASNLDMAEYDGYLYIATGHEGYVDEAVGQGHQGFLMYRVNETTMTGSIVDADLWHSFSQHIAIRDNDNIYVLEESEGSRATLLTRKTTSTLSGGTTISLLDYGGTRDSTWAIATFATADDVEISGSNVIAVGSSIDQTRYSDESYSKTYDIYLTTTPLNDFSAESTSFRWFTDKKLSGGFTGIKLTKISDNRFMISWGEYGEAEAAAEGSYSTLNSSRFHYMFIDGSGNPVSQEFTAPGKLSECDPVISGGKAVFYSSDTGSVVFYSINTDTGEVSRKEYLSAGPSASWSFADGTVTVSGSGSIYKDFAYEGLSAIRDQITKVVIKGGITTISEGAFRYLNALTEVVIEDGVTAIEDEAFYGNYDLAKITIPSSVTSIGKDVFDTGYTWIGSGRPVINVTIYCEKGSAAEAYAKANGIKYVLPEEKVPEQPSQSDSTSTETDTTKADGYQPDPASGAVSAGANSLQSVEKTITGMKADGDIKGSSFSPIRLQSSKVSKKSVKLSWKKINGAKKYVIYGNKCGNKNKPKKLATVTGNKYTVKKIGGKKLSKGKYYKFIVVAVDAQGNVISCSKTIHAATSGGKVGNHKSISIKKAVVNKAKKLKKGKKLKLGAKAVKVSKKLSVKKHVGIRYESSNKKVASVSSKGIVKGKKKGSCYIYAYAQNGVYKKIKVTVR